MTLPSPDDYSKKSTHVWSHACCRDEFFKDLAKAVDPNRSNTVTDERNYLTQLKYYAQARKLIYWIPITIPEDLTSLIFIINLSDLSPRCRKEFEEFVDNSTKQEIALFLKEIATLFFEAIDFDYTHLSVIPHIAVRYEN